MKKDDVYLWSRLSLTKKTLLLPLYFFMWQVEFVKNYWLNDVHLVFYDNYLVDGKGEQK